MYAGEDIHLEDKKLSLSKIELALQKQVSLTLDSGDHFPQNFEFSIESKKDDRQ